MDSKITASIMTTHMHNDGKFQTHIEPDVDALFGLWIIYHFLKGLFNTSVVSFIEEIELKPACHRSIYPMFGIDIGTNMSETHIKSSNTPIMINGQVFNNPCASMYLAYHLLSKGEFDSLQSLIVAIHFVDTEGRSNVNNSPNHTTLWGILGAIQNNYPLDELFVVVDKIFNAILSHTQNKTHDIMIHLKDVRLIPYKGFKIAMPPMNAGRHVSQKCFRELYATLIIFSSYDPVTKLGTAGISVSRKFSESFNIPDILNSSHMRTMIKDLRGNIYSNDHVIGRTDKSPFYTTQKQIAGYRISLYAAAKELIDNGMKVAADQRPAADDKS